MVCHVRVENRNGFEKMLKAFKTACQKRGIIREINEHTYYEKPSDKRRRKLRKRELERSKEAALKKRR